MRDGRNMKRHIHPNALAAAIGVSLTGTANATLEGDTVDWELSGAFDRGDFNFSPPAIGSMVLTSPAVAESSAVMVDGSNQPQRDGTITVEADLGDPTDDSDEFKVTLEVDGGITGPGRTDDLTFELTSLDWLGGKRRVKAVT